MHRNRLARGLALSAATLSGLGLFFVCLGTVQAQGTAASAAAPAAQTWHVDNSPGDGLVGYWKFDQVFDGATLNSALLTNTTVLSGGASITSTVVASVTVPDTGSLRLDGVNDTALVSDAGALDVSPAAFSVAAWVRRESVGTYDAIYDDAGDNSRVPSFVVSDLDGGARFINVASVPDTGAGSPPIVDIGAYELNNALFLPLVTR